MNGASVRSRHPTRAPFHGVWLFLPAAVLFVSLTGIFAWRSYSAGMPELLPNGMPISREIEERFGVRLMGVHVLAKGGLVDLRYRVVDAGKAKNFGHYTETSPLLIAEDSGRTVEVTIMGLHNHRVEAGRSYYVLYRNTGNAIQPSGKVTIQIGDLRLSHVVAQ